MYGLRIGDVLSLGIEDEARFSAKVKGGEVRSFYILGETVELLCPAVAKREPFKGIALSTVQGRYGSFQRIWLSYRRTVSASYVGGIQRNRANQS